MSAALDFREKHKFPDHHFTREHLKSCQIESINSFNASLRACAIEQEGPARPEGPCRRDQRGISRIFRAEASARLGALVSPFLLHLFLRTSPNGDRSHITRALPLDHEHFPALRVEVQLEAGIRKVDPDNYVPARQDVPVRHRNRANQR